MEREGFIRFLEIKKKSAKTIARYTDFVERYEVYLFEHKNGKAIEESAMEDLHDFEAWCDENFGKVGQHLWGVKEYYAYLLKEDLQLEADAMIGERHLSGFKLKDFFGVKPNSVEALEKEGITTAKEMLHAGLNERMRKELSRKTGIPEEDVLELVKLSDQARIGGHKKVRARLYHEAGFDTLDKIAACDPEEMRERLADFIRRTGFQGIPPTPGEARHTVTMAKYLKRLVEY